MADLDLAARPGFGALLRRAGPERAGIAVVERDGLGLATVQARAGKTAALRQKVQESWGVELPDGPRLAGASGGLGFIGIAPGAWLALDEAGGPGLARRLEEHLAGLASVAEQSDGYAVLRLTGRHVRDALAKGVTIDLHPEAFGPGSAAVTAISHVGAVLWRPLAGAGEDVFDIAVARSYAGSFWHWLEESAAEFGLEVGDR